MAALCHGVDGETCKVSVDCPTYLDGTALSPAGTAYIDTLISLRDAGKAAAAVSLLDIYNETWRREDDPVLDRAGFEARLAVSSVQVLDEPNRGTLYFSDGGLFMGHRVEVSFSGGEVEFVELLG